ncbi:MAG: hypothetical protein JJT76_02175 [Clostridiaceae bacterium]|nr:hypothetical protein [Clostridiaceae bacterium]
MFKMLLLKDFYAYINAQSEAERKKAKRNILTTLGVWAVLLLLLSSPIIFIIVIGKIQGI